MSLVPRIRRTLGIRDSFACGELGGVAQLGERVLCKHEVGGSIPLASILRRLFPSYNVAGGCSLTISYYNEVNPVGKLSFLTE